MAQDTPPVEAVLDALGTLEHPRADIVLRFASVALRRAPDHLVSRPPLEVARWLRSAFDALDARQHGEAVVRVHTDRADDPLGARVEVLSEDRPFLLSTIVAELTAHGLTVRGSFHPIVGVEREADGRIVEVTAARPADQRESVLYVDVEGELTPSARSELVTAIELRLEDVRRVTDDHAPMRARLEHLSDELRAEADASDLARSASTRADHDRSDSDPTEVADLLAWLLDDNLVLLGLEERNPDGAAMFGLLAAEHARRPQLSTPIGAGLLSISRTAERSPVQRRVPMEVFEFRRPGRDPADGHLVLLGLLTRKGAGEPARATPVLRRRLRAVFEREDIVDGSHDALTLTALFQAIPKDELFRTRDDELRELLLALLQAEEHRSVLVLLRPHPPSGTASVVVAIPRDRWTAALRERLRTELARRCTARQIEVDVAVDDRREALARFVIEVGDPAELPDEDELQQAVVELARPWEESLTRELAERLGRSRAQRLRPLVVDRLPASYRETTPPAVALTDVLLLEQVIDDPTPLLIAVRSLPGPIAEDGTVRLIAAKRGEALELSAFLPILESLGLTVVDEIPHRLEAGDGPALTLHDFGIRAGSLDPDADGPRLADAILAAWRGHLGVDALNQLVLVADLDWRDVSILRAYRRLRRQLGTAYTPAYVDSIVVGNPDVVRALIVHIHARFDPEIAVERNGDDATRIAALERLDALNRLDHDRVLRGLLHLIDATLRTNAFRVDARADDSGEPYLAIKLDPSRIPDAPRPVPHREIFVHSTRVEGIHLRAGPVARGGVRWSDRADDVRTEVLDLLKAQVLKNALIVPTGAKGGFVVKHEPADPTALREEVHRQYVTFVRALLDVTDDLDGDAVVPPPDVVRHDGDDPYLVVAADRGTAAFSDTANEVAARYGFWLDDAFASGGSNGYDHKALGVTARGAWVAVERHFRELGMDATTDPVTAVGIGDMSGDVFGNALLRSRSVRLVAAFDHRHVFVDPDPDPQRSFEERQRLFHLPTSSWDDYDRSVLSAGGLIVPRAARSVTLSAEAKRLLRLESATLTPPELIRAILRAPTDLLFAGGIGTYVKASTERHEELGDRANDELRVDATEVRARVIGEGANLFITQRARIELARRGGRINQDAVDNAAGVATSDLEVNLKILLRLAEERGELDRPGRDALLAELAEDVVAEVLSAVDQQTAAISREVRRSPAALDAYGLLITRLERDAELDRAAEALPSTEELAARAEAEAGLSRPELATLLAWAKRDLKERLLASEVPDSPLCREEVHRAFPVRVVERFPHLPRAHRLRRELIATVVANDIVDRMGVSFVSRLAEETDTSLSDTVLAFQAVRTVIGTDRWWARFDELDRQQEPERVRELEVPLEELLTTFTRVLLSDPLAPHPEDLVGEQTRIATAVLEGLTSLGTADQRRGRIAHARWLVDDLVEPDLARLLACVRDLALVPDVATIRAQLAGRRDGEADRDDPEVLDALLRVGEALGIERLEDALRRASGRSDWARRQRLGLAMDLRRARRAAVARAFITTPDAPVGDVIERFLDGRRAEVARSRQLIADAEAAEGHPLDALAVAARSVRETVERRVRRP